MPVPPNTSFSTATDLGTLTGSYQTFTQQIDDGATNYTTYYTFLAPAGSVELGAFGRTAALATTITTKPYIGPASSPTQLLVGSTLISAADKPLEAPITALERYYLECEPDTFASSPTILLLDVAVFFTGAVPVGSFAVNDDTASGFPLVFLSGTTDYAVVNFIHPFPFGESGDVLVDGTVLIEDFENTSVALYNPSMQLIVNTDIPGSLQQRIRTCLGANKFYIFTNQNPTKVYSMTGTGILSSAETLTAMTSCIAGAATNDEAFYYHALTGNNQPIRVWEVGVGAAANLVAGVADHVVEDLLVLGDDTIIAAYYKGTVTRAYFIRHYDDTGTTLNTYTFATPSSSAPPRLAYAIDDPNSFWVMFQPESDHGIKQFFNIKVSDGTILHTRTAMLFQAGVYQGSATLTPPGIFGAAPSCPFWIVRTAATPTTTTFTIRRERRFLLPSSRDNKVMRIPYLELLGRTGIGLLPDSAGSDTPLGVDPQVHLRISKDGGKTWLPAQARSMGLRGHYKDRVRWLQTPNAYRNAVVEIVVDAPVDWQFVAMEGGDPDEGSS